MRCLILTGGETLEVESGRLFGAVLRLLPGRQRRRRCQIGDSYDRALCPTVILARGKRLDFRPIDFKEFVYFPLRQATNFGAIAQRNVTHHTVHDVLAVMHLKMQNPELGLVEIGTVAVVQGH